MASIETLQNRVNSFKDKIEQKRNLIEKKQNLINKKVEALKKLGYNYVEDKDTIISDFREGKNRDAYWLMSDIEGYEDDMLRIEKEILDFSKSLESYEKELIQVQSKAESRNVKIILDFLENWRQDSEDWYESMFDKYYKADEELKELYKKMASYGYDTSNPGYKEAYKNYSDAYKAIQNKLYGYTEKVDTKYGPLNKKVRNGEWEYITHYVSNSKHNEASEKLQKDLKREVERKYDYIIEKTNEIVGTITDASNLRIDGRANLNGIIIGTDGKAKVETIIASGPIQRSHFRTLIKPLKD